MVCIVAGLLKLASLWGLVNLDWLWQQPWTQYLIPVAIIYLGIKLICHSFWGSRDQWLRRPLPIGEEGKRLHCATSLGGDEYIFRGEPFHGAQLDATFGGIRMDLRQAIITEDEEIDIHTVFGGVELYVPTSVNVVVKSRSIFGAVGNERDQDVIPDAPCLHIVASNVFGGVSIKS